MLIMFWSGFLTWIQWWCPFCDQNDHMWQFRETYKCYIWFWAVFWREFNGDVRFVIRMTIYGNSGKHISVIYGFERFFDVNSVVKCVLWLEWPYMAIPETCKCYIWFWAVFNGNPLVMSVLWSEWPYMVIPGNI